MDCILDVSYGESAPLLEQAIAASIRVANLRITFEGMFHSDFGEENRAVAAKPRQRIKKSEYNSG